MACLYLDSCLCYCCGIFCVDHGPCRREHVTERRGNDYSWYRCKWCLGFDLRESFVWNFRLSRAKFSYSFFIKYYKYFSDSHCYYYKYDHGCGQEARSEAED